MLSDKINKSKIRQLVILFVMTFFAVISSCEKSEVVTDTLEDAVITGYDMRMCACCGGWYIKIDTSSYRFFSIPDGSGFKLDTISFPFNVRVKWSKRANPCLGDEIEIEFIRHVN